MSAEMSSKSPSNLDLPSVTLIDEAPLAIGFSADPDPDPDPDVEVSTSGNVASNLVVSRNF
jgi:hypothetical protein